MKSYVMTKLSLPARIDEAKNLYLHHTRHAEKNVSELIDQARRAEVRLEMLLGKPISDLNLLEIGPGQQLIQMAYFGRKNDVTGIDRDLVPERPSALSYVKMARENGWVRTSKTLGRKLMGIDRLVRRQMMRQLGLLSIKSPRVLQMDAARMTFADQSFDAVFSRAVFEHLSDPRPVLAEIRRVLKPGGAMFVALHLYSSDSGCHDTRIFLGDRGDIPPWSHLRPQHQSLVHPNSYLNKLSLSAWQELFQSEMPGSQVFASCDAGDEARKILNDLRAKGELENYSDEELLTVTLEISWRKATESGEDTVTAITNGAHRSITGCEK